MTFIEGGPHGTPNMGVFVQGEVVDGFQIYLPRRGCQRTRLLCEKDIARLCASTGEGQSVRATFHSHRLRDTQGKPVSIGENPFFACFHLKGGSEEIRRGDCQKRVCVRLRHGQAHMTRKGGTKASAKGEASLSPKEDVGGGHFCQEAP